MTNVKAFSAFRSVSTSSSPGLAGFVGNVNCYGHIVMYYVVNRRNSLWSVHKIAHMLSFKSVCIGSISISTTITQFSQLTYQQNAPISQALYHLSPQSLHVKCDTCILFSLLYCLSQTPTVSSRLKSTDRSFYKGSLNLILGMHFQKNSINL